MAPEVQFLRNFRDNHLEKTSVGVDFMNVFNQWYYSFSPTVANYEAQNPLLREVIKDSIYPLLGILLVSEKAFFLIGGNYGTMAAGLIAVSMMGTVYVSPLILSIKGIRSGKINLKFAAFVVLGILVATIGAILSGNQSVIILTSLLLLLSLIAFTALSTAKMFVGIGRRIARKRNNHILKRNR
ncbi:MAG: CFI-box-CTERM domain-containing protein [Nitrososphaera sp.]